MCIGGDSRQGGRTCLRSGCTKLTEKRLRSTPKTHCERMRPSSRCGVGISILESTSTRCSPPILKQGTTTVMVRNIPTNVTQVELIRDLDQGGFGDRFDFCYAPRQSFHSRQCTGFAFVNFVSTQAAEDFARDWHNSRRFGVSPRDPGLNVSSAIVQGREANTAKAFSTRFRHIKNPNCKPFVATLTSSRKEPRVHNGSWTEQVSQPSEGSVAVTGLLAELGIQGPHHDRHASCRARCITWQMLLDRGGFPACSIQVPKGQVQAAESKSAVSLYAMLRADPAI